LKVAAITVTVRYSYSMAWELETNKMGLLKLQIFLPSGVETASQFDEFSM
jgi:hypothetical protein